MAARGARLGLVMADVPVFFIGEDMSDLEAIGVLVFFIGSIVIGAIVA